MTHPWMPQGVLTAGLAPRLIPLSERAMNTLARAVARAAEHRGERAASVTLPRLKCLEQAHDDDPDPGGPRRG